MKIIKPYATLLHRDSNLALRFIEWCGRISHRSEEQQSDESTTRRFIENVVLRHGDWSIVEHFSCSVDFYVDRGITHEIVRHRLAAYTQESTRFVNYEKKMPPSFIYPVVGVECVYCLEGKDHVVTGHAPFKFSHLLKQYGDQIIEVDCKYDTNWLNAITAAEWNYRELLLKGWRPQEARSVFPNALASRLIMTCNLRQWRHFFLMRTSKEAHPQMKQVTIPLLNDFKQHFPVLFDDIQPEQRQVENLQLGR